jgi:hypothetical protein
MPLPVIRHLFWTRTNTSRTLHFRLGGIQASRCLDEAGDCRRRCSALRANAGHLGLDLPQNAARATPGAGVQDGHLVRFASGANGAGVFLCCSPSHNPFTLSFLSPEKLIFWGDPPCRIILWWRAPRYGAQTATFPRMDEFVGTQ